MVDWRMSGQPLPPPKITCGRFFNIWLEQYAKSRVAPTTLSSYQDIVRVHLRPAFANTLLGRLTPHHVVEYVSRKKSDGLSGTTCLYHYRLLHKILNDAVFWGDLGSNPADRCTLHRSGSLSRSFSARNKFADSYRKLNRRPGSTPCTASQPSLGAASESVSA